jgi:hypothetical protein
MTNETRSGPGVHLIRIRPAATPAGHGWFLVVRDHAVDRLVRLQATAGNLAEVVDWGVLPGIEEAARARVLRYQGGSAQPIGTVKDGKWTAWWLSCPQPPVPEMPPAPGTN